MAPEEVRDRIGHHIHTQTLDSARDVVRDRNRLAGQPHWVQIRQVYHTIKLQVWLSFQKNGLTSPGGDESKKT